MDGAGDEERRDKSASYELRVVGADASEKISLWASLLSVSISMDEKLRGVVLCN